MTRRMTAHAMHACSPTISNHGGWTKLSSLSHTHTHTHTHTMCRSCVRPEAALFTPLGSAAGWLKVPELSSMFISKKRFEGMLQHDKKV
mmetsp:Transcript_21137/g.41003  ORF Transcript_21137/g.41003 Transcript_21137/m.41003 type:complete len:89 (-) Transcript_21137:1004-1270(-)